MTRETRIALLVGVAFIVLFGLVLGERSLRLARESRPAAPVAGQVAARPGPEVVAAAFERGSERPVLSPRRTSPRPARPATGRPRPAAERPPRQQPRPPAAPTPAAPTRPGESPGRAASSPAPQPPPAPRPRGSIYKVQSGDTLIRIARKVWGRRHEAKYLRIFQANRDKLTSASALFPGQELLIPPLEAERPAASPVAPAAAHPHYRVVTLEALERQLRARRVYTVRSGDCLTAIARREMGDGSPQAVQRLYEANRSRIDDPNRLPVGLKLRIPS